MRIKLRKNKSTLDIEQIPFDIQSLEIIGESIETLPSLKRYYNLKSLYINCPQLNSFKDFPESLNTLKIRDGIISRDCLIEISHLCELKILSLMNLKIKALPDQFFSKLKNLSTIDFKSNALENIPNGICEIKSLTRINIDQNEFTKFPQVLFTMTSLNHISADHNKFDEKEKALIHKRLGLWF